MAIQQCLEYLDKYNWKLVETEDTALSAKHVHQHRSKHIAAIASKLAADLFNLEVIAPNIHTMKSNYTRFLVLQPEEVAPTGTGCRQGIGKLYYRSLARQPGKGADPYCRWRYQPEQTAKLSYTGQRLEIQLSCRYGVRDPGPVQ